MFVGFCVALNVLMHALNSFSPLTHLPAAGDEDTFNSGTSHPDCLTNPDTLGEDDDGEEAKED